MRKTITVTKRDIKNGLPEDMSLCPIALAIRRAFHCKLWVYVDNTEASICFMRDKEMHAALPARARKFVLKYDKYENGESASKKLKPFTFKTMFAKS